MSTDPEQPTPDTTTSSDTPPEPPIDTDPNPDPGPEPEEETPTPEAPPAPTQPIIVEPATWYEVESVCKTTTCVNFNHSTTEPEVYSNAGTIRMICARCGQVRLVLSATKLDPQPEMS
jgi:hypothetical protein